MKEREERKGGRAKERKERKTERRDGGEAEWGRQNHLCSASSHSRVKGRGREPGLDST